MIKKDFILYGLVAILIISGFYIIGNGWNDTKQLTEYNESKQVALNWINVTSVEVTCNDIEIKLINLEKESFDGKELIIDAITLKYLEFEC